MTDKATVTIPSPRRGKVTKLLYEVGQVAKVHEPLLEMALDHGSAEARPNGAGSSGGADGAQAAGPRAAAAGAHEAPATASGGVAGGAVAVATPAPARRGGSRALATPAVRAMARQLGIDINTVAGSGPGGRVTKGDLEALRQGVAHPAFHETPEEAPPVTRSSTDQIVPLRGIRRRIAERMAQSKRTAAHFTFVEQVDVTDLQRVKDRIAQAAKEQNVRVTFLPFIVKATVAALKKHPWLNATLDEGQGEIRLRREYHIGIASATEHGLLVPVVRNADQRSLLDLAREIDRLASAARDGKSRPEDMGGSTFTITSLGAQGGLLATPVINHPEVAILGVHRIRPTPVVRDGQIVARDVMNVSLSSDHRVVDGHVAAAFTYEVVRYPRTRTSSSWSSSRHSRGVHLPARRDCRRARRIDGQRLRDDRRRG
jgi:pyruvate dehydrogenase E2 component (dihydrolipoamide acetyltransferase)